jgi:allantoicase
MNSFIIKYTLAIVILAVLVLLVQGDFFSPAPLVIMGQVAAIASSCFLEKGVWKSGIWAFGRTETRIARAAGSIQV